MSHKVSCSARLFQLIGSKRCQRSTKIVNYFLGIVHAQGEKF